MFKDRSGAITGQELEDIRNNPAFEKERLISAYGEVDENAYKPSAGQESLRSGAKRQIEAARGRPIGTVNRDTVGDVYAPQVDAPSNEVNLQTPGAINFTPGQGAEQLAGARGAVDNAQAGRGAQVDALDVMQGFAMGSMPTAADAALDARRNDLAYAQATAGNQAMFGYGNAGVDAAMQYALAGLQQNQAGPMAADQMAMMASRGGPQARAAFLQNQQQMGAVNRAAGDQLGQTQLAQAAANLGVGMQHFAGTQDAARGFQAGAMDASQQRSAEQLQAMDAYASGANVLQQQDIDQVGLENQQLAQGMALDDLVTESNQIDAGHRFAVEDLNYGITDGMNRIRQDVDFANLDAKQRVQDLNVAADLDAVLFNQDATLQGMTEREKEAMSYHAMLQGMADRDQLNNIAYTREQADEILKAKDRLNNYVAGRQAVEFGAAEAHHDAVMGGIGTGVQVLAALASLLSDEGTKENIKKKDAPDFRNVGFYEYEYKPEWKTDPGAVEGKRHGPMAQELRGLPGVVTPGKDGMLRINMAELILQTTSAVGELQREIDELKEEKEDE